MPSSASATPAAISLYDARPFFEKALQFGVANGLIDRAKLDAIGTDAPKGMVQIARYFGNEFLRPDIEKAKDRLVNLVSLHLESASGGDLRRAAELLRDHSFLSRSKAGSDMLRALLALPDSTSFDAHHDELNGIDSKSPPKGLAEWTLKRLADYQAELAKRLPFQQEKDAALWLAAQLEQLTGLESRVTILGYLQRGGTPSAADRLLATRHGTACADLIAQSHYGVMVAAKGDGTKPVPLEDVAGKLKYVPPDNPWVNTARRVGTCLGD